MNRLFRKLHIEHYLSSRLVLILDTIVTLTASATALMLMQILFKPFIMPHPSQFTIQWLGVACIASLLFFYLLKTYRSVIRHSTLREISHLTLATLGKETMLFALLIFHPDTEMWNVQHTALMVFDTLITLCLLILIRVAMVVAYDMIQHRLRNRNGRRILIYGTDSSSVAMLQQLNASREYDVVGFLTFGRRLRNHTINDHRVFYFEDKESMQIVADRHDIHAILFTSKTEMRNEQKRLLSYAAECNLKMLFTPPINELTADNIAHNMVREINIEDLLMRPEIKISMEEISADLNGKCVLVTGAAGSIGSEICRQLATLGIKELVLFDNAETPMHNIRLELEESFPNLKFHPIIGDVRNTVRLDYTFNTFKPDVVFHAAAYKHVPLMEENPCEAVYVNVCGSRNVADYSLKHGVKKMVMISTDKAVNPTNIMGATKRMAEIYVQSLGLAIANGTIEGSTQFITTRFGNVLGSNGSVIPRFRAQIAKGGPVTVTHPDITRFFMTIPEACRLVLEAAHMSSGNDIFVFDMGEPVRITDLAYHMIELAGYTPNKDIKIEYTGLRPGEKLYEEVLANEENTCPTSHGRIRIANVREMAYDSTCEIVSQLEEMALNVDIDNMVRLIKQSIPEYKSENSKFKALD